jgi:hypothetical protein
MGIDGNEVTDQLARHSSSLPLIGPELARGVIRGWTSRKHKEYWHYIHGQRQAGYGLS